MTKKSNLFRHKTIENGIIIAIIGIVVSLFVPEVRLFLGIDKNNETVKNQSEIGIIQEQIQAENEIGYVDIDVLGIAIAKKDINDVAELSWQDANNLCKNSILGGHKDWRLPTIDELTTIFQIKNSVGGFSNAYYWSSTVDSRYAPIYMKAIHMKKGTTVSRTDSYNTKYLCRCVRTLPEPKTAE